MKQLASIALSLLLPACTSVSGSRPSPATDPAIAGAIAQIGAAAERNPDLPQLRYLLATYHDQARDTASVVKTLAQLEAGGWSYGITTEDFRNSKGREFDAVAARLNAAEPKVAKSSVAFTLPERDLIAEGITVDPADGSFYVGSIHQRKIVRITRDGAVTDFITPDDGALAILGVKVDPARRMLWAASMASENMRGYVPGQKGQAAIAAYDLATGRRARLITAGSADAPSLLNDIAILEDGSLLVTDSTRGLLLRLAPQSSEFVVVAKDFRYPNGIVTWKGTHALVDDFLGLWRVDLATGERVRLGAPQGVLLSGIDGMSLDGSSLVGVQNGVGRPRIVRIHLNEDATAATRVETLENASPHFDIPTTGTILGGDFYFIANAQLRAFNEDHTIWPAERLKPTVILRVPLR